jgi:hypothetical protein
MEYGHVCFAYSKNEWIAKAIAWFTNSQWSHTFVTMPPVLGKEMALEAAQGGTQPVMFDPAYRNNPNQKYEMYRVKVDQDTIDQAILKCLERLEMPYGYLEYPWFIWRSINRWFGKDIKGQDNWSQKDEVCAGLSDFYIEGLSLQILFQGFGKNSITAQDIYEIVKANPHLFELIEKKD